jgi:tetratricopeptide (TPR) repeat protein
MKPIVIKNTAVSSRGFFINPIYGLSLFLLLLAPHFLHAEPRKMTPMELSYFESTRKNIDDASDFAVTHGEKANWLKVVQICNSAAKKLPKEPLVEVGLVSDLFSKRALAEKNLGQFHEAIADYDKAIQIRSHGWPREFLERGECRCPQGYLHCTQEDLKACVKDLRQGIQTAREMVDWDSTSYLFEARLELGKALLPLGEKDEARRLFQDICKDGNQILAVKNPMRFNGTDRQNPEPGESEALHAEARHYVDEATKELKNIH